MRNQNGVCAKDSKGKRKHEFKKATDGSHNFIVCNKCGCLYTSTSK